MLVLSRRVGERLLIGDGIVVTVIEVRGDGVRLGIDAPREVRVHRAEVLEAVTAANVDAGAADDSTAAALRALAPARPRAPRATPPATDSPSDATGSASGGSGAGESGPGEAGEAGAVGSAGGTGAGEPGLDGTAPGAAGGTEAVARGDEDGGTTAQGTGSR